MENLDKINLKKILIDLIRNDKFYDEDLKFQLH
jgi:hypothetical protein